MQYEAVYECNTEAELEPHKLATLTASLQKQLLSDQYKRQIKAILTKRSAYTGREARVSARDIDTADLTHEEDDELAQQMKRKEWRRLVQGTGTETNQSCGLTNIGDRILGGRQPSSTHSGAAAYPQPQDIIGQQLSNTHSGAATTPQPEIIIEQQLRCTHSDAATCPQPRI